MRVKTVPSSWLKHDGRRLDCGPYMSGALEAKVRLEQLSACKERLADLCDRGEEGIYHAGRESRTWVESAEFGVPFLSSSDVVKADLSMLPLISKRQVARNPRFTLRHGWTLITRSGTIGRMAYARRDMDGMACSEHVMRVVPDQQRILPGYLFAYLSSKFGVPLVVGGTYGAIIQHIEPHHIANLPVPRLGDRLERKAHRLVAEAATLRARASRTIEAVSKDLQDRIGLSPLVHGDVTSFGVSAVQYSSLECRLDAPFHSAAALEAEQNLDLCGCPVENLADVVARYFKPPMFKRLWVDSEEYGRQFISGSDAYRYQAEQIRYVSFKTPNFDEFILRRGWLVFQAAGQIYGLFGRPLYVRGWLENLFCADDVYRLVPHTEVDGAYLYAFFRTPHGQVLLKRQACGNSIPRVWDPHMRGIRVPWPDESLRAEVAAVVQEAHDEIERARIGETEAVRLVQRAIEEAA